MAKRVQLRRTKGWRLPPGCIVVARPTRWGNVFVVGQGAVTYSGPILGPTAGNYDPKDRRWADQAQMRQREGLTAAEAVALYRMDLLDTLKTGDEETAVELSDALVALRGHDLACWCDLAAPCHADVLLEIANR
jgi:hypothetical protein